MTDRRAPETAECLHCGRTFTPRNLSHVFCAQKCRHLGERKPEDRAYARESQDAVARLFDPRRDPSERVRAGDWFPGGRGDQEAWKALHDHDTVEVRRRWYRNLESLGEL
jgi:hypothetical protein